MTEPQPSDLTRLLADSQPFAGDLSLYCTICGSIQGAGDRHRPDCAWRLARRSLGLDTDWPEPTDEPTEADRDAAIDNALEAADGEMAEGRANFAEWRSLFLAELAEQGYGVRALVGGRSAAPTRDEEWRDLALDAIAYIDTFKNTRPDRGKAASQYGERAALLSRSAAEPPEDHPLTMATAVECPRCGNDRTPGMDGLMSMTCSRCGTLAEPVPSMDPWPGEVYPDRGRWAFRCGIDGCEMNGTGYATRADAERRLRTHGATETCPFTYGVAAEPPEDHVSRIVPSRDLLCTRCHVSPRANGYSLCDPCLADVADDGGDVQSYATAGLVAAEPNEKATDDG